MAHYARVVNGQVVKIHVVNNSVITDRNGKEIEKRGQTFLAKLHGYNSAELIQCSYNGNFRGNYPGVGWTYDSAADIFVQPVVEAEIIEDFGDASAE